MNLDQRFTAIADRITTFVGRWWFTSISLLLMLGWTLYGLLIIRGDWFTSPSWNFPLNTITTAGEWLLEGLILAAANRVERHNNELLEKIEKLLEKTEHQVEKIDSELQK